MAIRSPKYPLTQQLICYIILIDATLVALARDPSLGTPLGGSCVASEGTRFLTADFCLVSFADGALALCAVRAVASVSMLVPFSFSIDTGNEILYTLQV